MNNYIIDPSVFYWINTLSNIAFICKILSFFACCGTVILTCLYIFNIHGLNVPEKPQDEIDKWEMERYNRYFKEYEKDKAKANMFRNSAIIVGIIALIIVCAAIFIPAKTTSVEMLVAKTATFDNVNWTVQQVKEIIDYITSSLRGVVQ